MVSVYSQICVTIITVNIRHCALGGVAQLVEDCPVHKKITGLIPDQVIYAGYGFNP